VTDPDRKHLRVVDPPPSPQQDARGQLPLPFVEDKFVLVLAHVTNVSEQSFLWLLQEVKPDTVVDLRLVPRFDFGRLNRKRAFHLFAEMSARYYDLSHDLGISDSHDASLNPAFFAEPLDRIVSGRPRAQRVLLFLGDAGLLARSLEVLPTRLSTPAQGRWQVRGFERADLGEAPGAQPMSLV
jgi:hypothetical protein